MDIIEFVVLICTLLVAYRILSPLLFYVILAAALWYVYINTVEGFVPYGGDDTYCQSL